MSNGFRLAKYNVHRYIDCIIDQSYWSGPLSLVVMTPDLESIDLGSRPGRSTRHKVFIYRSICPPTTFGVAVPTESKRACEIIINPKYLKQMWRNEVVRLAKYSVYRAQN